jgi:hypothetical protein
MDEIDVSPGEKVSLYVGRDYDDVWCIYGIIEGENQKIIRYLIRQELELLIKKHSLPE